jgi:3-phosphoshikimate 1-carboxyvinyltransferase
VKAMAQVSKISNGAQNTYTTIHLLKPQIPKSLSSISFRSQLIKGSSFGLKQCKKMGSCKLKVEPLKVLASIATAEKPSTVPEIVLQPIKDISGTVTLPGSKSLSNRILLLAALSEVILKNVYMMLEVFHCFLGFES